jgi:hypothetical protein
MKQAQHPPCGTGLTRKQVVLGLISIFVLYFTLSLFMVPIGVPSAGRIADRKIDVRGAILVAIASSATILGLSFAGTTYPWASPQIISLLSIALLFWVLFFGAEGHAEEPIMDPQVFRNRTFLTVSVSGMLSFIGLTAMMMYFPIYLQGVKGISVMRSGQILTPFTVLMAFIGLPTGFVLAKTKRYKWMYISGYGLLTAAMFGTVFFRFRNTGFYVCAGCHSRWTWPGDYPNPQHACGSMGCPQKIARSVHGCPFLQHHTGSGLPHQERPSDEEGWQDNSS